MIQNKKEIIKIAIVGPESTGKSTISKYLSQRFNTVCVPEYSRYYCSNLQRQYTLQDELNMFYGQLALEDALTPLVTNNLLITDTTILTVKIWSDHLFGYTPSEVLNEIHKKNYDLYLLMDIDLPWEDDPLRDFPQQRAHFLNVWQNELQAIQANYEIISGFGETRYQNAYEAIKKFLHTTN